MLTRLRWNNLHVFHYKLGRIQSHSFHQALNSLKRPDLLSIAMKLPNLCVSEHTQGTDLFAEPLSMKSLLELLRTEISQIEWKIISLGMKDSLPGKYEFGSKIKDCLESQSISKDLSYLERALKAINCFDIVTKIKESRQCLSKCQKSS